MEPLKEVNSNFTNSSIFNKMNGVVGKIFEVIKSPKAIEAVLDTSVTMLSIGTVVAACVILSNKLDGVGNHKGYVQNVTTTTSIKNSECIQEQEKKPRSLGFGG